MCLFCPFLANAFIDLRNAFTLQCNEAFRGDARERPDGCAPDKRIGIAQQTLGGLQAHERGRPLARVLLATEQLAPRLYMTAKGRSEPRELTKGWYPVPVGLSAEGGRLLYQDQTEPRDLNYDLYLQPLPEGPAQHLGPTATYAALAPDGSRVVAFQGNPMHPVIIPLGPGTARHLPNHGIADFPSFTHWTVDGRKLILTGRRPGEDQLHAYLQDISTGELQSLGPAGTQGGLPAQPTSADCTISTTSGRLKSRIWPAASTCGTTRTLLMTSAASLTRCT